MKVTLRKAAKIRNRIEDRLAELKDSLADKSSYRGYGQPQNFTKTISVYDTDVMEQLAKAESKIVVDYNQFVQLSNAMAWLRSEISTKNVECGISAILAAINALESQLKVVESLSKADVALNQGQLEARLEGERGKISRSTSPVESTISFPYLTDGAVESFKERIVELQNAVGQSHDSLENLNGTVTIEISSEIEQLFQILHII